MSGIRVVHVIDHMGAGGAQQLVAGIIPRQQEAGLAVALICLRGATPLAQKVSQAGVPIYYLNRHRADPRQRRDLDRLLATLRPQLLHLHLSASGLVGRMFLGKHGVEGLVLHDHEASAEIFITPGPILAARRLIERGDHCRNIQHFVVSKSAYMYALTVRRLPQQQVALIPNGIDIAALQSGRLTQAEARRHLQLPEGIDLIVSAGRLAPEKGADTLVASLAHLDAHVHLLLAGRGPLEQQIRQQVANLRLTERVHLTGHLDDIRPALWAADVYVQPSRREAFGIAAAEASALGLPVIASHTGGLTDVVIDRVSGLLVPAEDTDRLSSAIQTLLNDRSLAAQLGEAGRLHAQRFDIGAIVGQIDKAYQRLMTPRKGSSNEPV